LAQSPPFRETGRKENEIDRRAGRAVAGRSGKPF
jgi:hypothetical protein